MKKFLTLLSLPALITGFIACNRSSRHEPGFANDLAFLQKYDSVIVLTTGGSRVVVSPKYQGKVFTSTADGKQSFGWINYKAFDAPPDAHMNAYGGENRLWLGPEGNRYSLFFKKGKQQVFENWQTPAPFDHEPWELLEASPSSVRLLKRMHMTSYNGTDLQLTVTRNITVLDRAAIGGLLGIQIGGQIAAVAYRTENGIVNTGVAAWDSASGAPCLWVLDMFQPSDQVTIAVPYNQRVPQAVTPDYFGAIPASRLRTDSGVLYFRADGKQRGKLGISPAAAGRIAGSYDALNGVLTLVVFDLDPEAAYLNQQWGLTKPALRGDAVNAYNDGPLTDGGQL
ncbi:MAG: hypothetical protein JO301_01755, partial [Chitinophagaceae bacterium]|nr:hypothetical protein [Chitinophagaceae bacterium]